MNGKLLVVEGGDGSGKATQIKLLGERLQQNGINVVFEDFPRYDKFFGKLVGRFLKGEFGGLKEVDPHLASLPYALDRRDAAPGIRDSLSKGTWVLCNRYALANMAHQTAKLPEEKRDTFIDFLEELEYRQFGIPREDRIFFLSVPSEIGQQLVDKKGEREYMGGAARDIQEADLNHQLSATEMYKRLSLRYPHITTIDCCDVNGKLLSKESIHEMVWSKTLELYGDEIREGRIRRERE